MGADAREDGYSAIPRAAELGDRDTLEAIWASRAVEASELSPPPEPAREYVPQHSPLWLLPYLGDERPIVAETLDDLDRTITMRVAEATAGTRPALVAGWLRGRCAVGCDGPVDMLDLRPVTVDGAVWRPEVRKFYGVTSDMAIEALRDELRRRAAVVGPPAGTSVAFPPGNTGLSRAASVQGVGAGRPIIPPTVFVSYVHENDGHMAAVLDFVNFLRDPSGLEADCDRYHEGPRQIWPGWVRGRIDHSDFVIIVASPSMRWASDRIVNGRYRGVRDELAHLENLQKRDPTTWIPKILPVVLPGGSADDIPAFLDPHIADHYKVTALTETGAAKLLDTIRGVRRNPAPAVAYMTGSPMSPAEGRACIP